MEYRGGFTYPIKKGCENMNNADKIRSMSDEEMAKKLGRGLGCPVTADCMKMSGECKACWLDWLQQSAEGE